jgi:hypothetical protein
VQQNLEQEISFFRKIQDELKAKNPNGGYAVIKDETLLGVWLNRTDAIKEAVEKYGNVSLLVKNINDNQIAFINYSRSLNFCHGVSYGK